MLAFKIFHAFEVRHIGFARHAGGEDQLLGMENNFLAIAINCYDPFLLGFVIGRGFSRCLGPVIQLHDFGVHFEPITNLVFG